MKNIKTKLLKHKDLECTRCNWVWKSRKINPVACPSCKSRDWSKPIKEKNDILNCVQCNWSWKPKDKESVSCPKCKTYNWKGESK